jgi:DNA-directed RNA polymerase subunit RPC12/RpoP
MYKCYKCGRIVPSERLLEGSSPMCSCGSRIFVKTRPEQVKRVRVI